MQFPTYTIRLIGLIQIYRLPPEKRAERCVEEFEGQLNSDLANIPECEHERYICGYVEHLNAWLSAMAGCFSIMITGGSNFNNAKHEKMNNRERAKSDEFTEWREKALKAITKRVEMNKPAEQRADERWQALRREIAQKIAWGSVANCVSMIERLAYNGEIELVEKCLNLITEYNKTHTPFITARHKAWGFPEIARQVADKLQKKSERESSEQITNGVRVVKNFQADRVQLFFDGKPSAEIINQLKRGAFKWSPSNGCWQRQLTPNAIYATERILKGIN